MLAIKDELGEDCRVGGEGICSGSTVVGGAGRVRRCAVVMTTSGNQSG